MALSSLEVKVKLKVKVYDHVTKNVTFPVFRYG